MRKNTLTIAFASIFAAALIASGPAKLSEKEPGITDYRDPVFNSSPRPTDQDLGIGDYSDHG